MSMVAVPPPEYDALQVSIAELQALKASPGYGEYLKILSSELMRILLASLSCADSTELVRLQGQGQAVQRVLGILDEQLVQRNALAARIHAQVEAVRVRQGGHAPSQDRPWRTADSAAGF